MIRTIIAALILVAGFAGARAEETNWYIYFPAPPGTPAWMLTSSSDERPAAMGGLRLLYDIGLDTEIDRQLAALMGAVGHALTGEPAIPHERLGVAGDSVEVTIGGAVPATDAQLAAARARLEPLRGSLPGGGFEFDLALSGGFVRFTYSEAGLAFRTAELLDATVDAIGRRLARIDVEAIARTQGEDRIVLTLAGPGLDEAQAAIARGDGLLGLHLVTETLLTGPPNPVPSGLRVVPDAADPNINYLIEEQPIFGFDGFATAEVGTDPMSGMPVVTFNLTPDAARAFGATTSANVGRMLAIVVDGAVVSAPTIHEAILGGTGVISGNFDGDEALAIAKAIRAGDLPAPVTLVETRAIGRAWPAASPAADGGALAIELMAEEGGFANPFGIAADAYGQGLGKAGVQGLDADTRSVVLTMPVPEGGASGRATALALLQKRFEGHYSIRAVWLLGPLLVLEPDAGFVPAN